MTDSRGRGPRPIDPMVPPSAATASVSTSADDDASATRGLDHLLRSPRVRRFLAVGLSGVIVNLGAFYLLTGVLGLHRVLASAGAVEISILSNFLLNNAWTFRDRNPGAAASFGARLVRYNLFALVGMAIQLVVFEASNQVVMAALGSDDPGLFKYPAQLFGIVVATSWNFVSNLRWTWAQAEPPGLDEPRGAADE